MNKAEKFVNRVYADAGGSHNDKMSEVYTKLYERFPASKGDFWTLAPEYRNAVINKSQTT